MIIFRRIPFLTALLFLLAPMALAKGSGSNASLSLLELDDPLEACILAGAELFDLEKDKESPQLSVEEATETLVWAITFDQSVLEVEYENNFFSVSSEQVVLEPCAET